MKIKMKHPTGVIKEVKVGFSWTTFLFGGIPSIIRGHWGKAAEILLLDSITMGLYGIYKSFSVNEDYKEWLTIKGYEEIKE